MNNDAALVASSQAGDVAAFGQLIERYHNLVCAIAYARTGDRATSEDVAQETFLAAWRGIGDLREADKLRGWLCTIARNLGAKSTRGVQRLESLDAHAGELAGDDGPLDAMLDKETEATVWAALERLPETYREPLVLFYREEQSIKEVARGLGLSEETAKQRLSRGRQQLRDQMTELVERTLASGRPRKASAAAVLALIIASHETPALAATAKTSMRRAGRGKLAAGAIAALCIAGAVVVATRGSSAPSSKPTRVAGDLVTELRAARGAAPAAVTASACELRGALTGPQGPLHAGLVAVVETTLQATALDPLIIETGADGRWHALVTRGVYTLAASAPGHTARAQLITCAGATTDVDFAMTAGGPVLRGSVTDTGGGAIATATIWLADPQRPAQLFVTRTRTDGTFELTAPRGLYMAIVAHPDYTLDVRPITLGDAGAREALTLVPGASIEGIVTDETGAALANARVRSLAPAQISELPARWQVSAAYTSLLPVISDASGRFVMRGLPPGTARLVATAPRSASTSPVEVTLTMAESKSGVTLATAAAHAVAGFVVAAGSRVGEPNVQVFAARESDGVALPAMATTDALGHFELTGLAPGAYRLLAVGTGHAPFVGASTITVDVRDADDTLIELPRGTPVRGNAAAGAIVSLRAPAGPSPTAQLQALLTRAEVDEHGAFTLRAVAPGDYVIAATTFDQHGEAPLHVGAETVTAQIALAPRPLINGEVVDDRGTAVSGVLVSATPARVSDGLANLHTTVRTDEHGRFTIVGVLPGRHRLRVFDATGQRAWDGSAASAYRGVRVTVPASGAVTERLVIARGKRRLTGTVVDSTGAPVADAWIDVRPRGTRRAPELFSAAPIVTDEHGTFTIEDVATSALVVEAASANGTQRAAAIADGRAPLRLALLPITLLTASVLDAGLPLAAFEARITQLATGESRVLRGANGALSVPVQAGEYELVVSAPGGYVKQILTVTKQVPTLTLTLVPWSRVHGRITSATGEPWANATVYVHDALEPTLVRTGSDGSFRLERMMAGAVEITFSHETDILGMTTLEVELPLGQTLDVGTIASGALRQGLSGASPDLGLRFDVRDGGLAVVDVTPSSHGARAGFRVGDRVTRVGMSSISSEIEATTMMRSLSTAWRSRGRAVHWTVTRGGKPLALEVLVPN